MRSRFGCRVPGFGSGNFLKDSFKLLCLRPTYCGRRRTVFVKLSNLSALASVRASVCASRNIVTMTSCRVYLTYCHQTYINDAGWDRDKRFIFWGQKVKVKVTVEYNMPKTAIYSFQNSSGRRHTILDDLASSYIHLL